MISYHGGKKRSAKQIIEILPPSEMFVDVYGGSGAIAMEAVKSRKHNQVIYNDLDSYLVHYLKICRDRPEDLKKYLMETPIGRYLTNDLTDMLESDNPIEKAAAVFLACNFQFNASTVTKGRIKNPRIRQSNVISDSFQMKESRIKKMLETADILRHIYFENRDALKIINLYSCYPKSKEYVYSTGDVNIIFFLDPPYGDSQEYRHKNSELDLIKFFQETEWTVALCGIQEEQPELDGYEFYPFLDTNGNAKRSLRRTLTFHNGMWVRFRKGWKHKKSQGALF